MTLRPPDLPDFGNPPVTEVVLGVQFGSLDQLLAPHLGLIWTEFRDQFPNIEEHPPIDPVFETFVERAAAPMPAFQFEVLAAPPTPRVFFINTRRTELLQVQRDRFIHNWRKIGDGDQYPRFERMLETFEAGYAKIRAVIEREGLGSIIPNQCEVSYINQIPVPPEQTPFTTFAGVFGSFAALSLSDLDGPEDARFMSRYVIKDERDAPVGRLIVSAVPARKIDGTNILQLTLIARGKPGTSDINGVRDFLRVGRRHIVRAFTEMTNEEMHKLWERRQ